MEFLQRHLPRVYQAVQDALNFFTNVTAQVFGAPPNAPQPRDARTNVPIQTPKESAGGPPAEKEECGRKETNLLTSIPELSSAKEENGDSAKVLPGDEDYRTRETDLRHRKSDPGGRRDLEYRTTEDVDIILHTTAEVTTYSYGIEVRESTDLENIVTISHDAQSILNQEQVNPPGQLDLKKENRELSISCEIKVSQYEEAELIPRTVHLASNEPLQNSEHKVYKDGQHFRGQPSSADQREESVFQPTTLKSLSFEDEYQLGGITGQERPEEELKMKYLIELTTESEDYTINTEQGTQVLVESIESTVIMECDADNILDVNETHKKLVTPVGETEVSSYSQGGDSRKTLEDLLETANRLAKHCDSVQNVEDQKGSDNVQDLDETPGSIPESILSKEQGFAEEVLTYVDDILAKSTFLAQQREHKEANLEEETMKEESLVLEQSEFSGESNSNSAEEGEDMSTVDVKVEQSKSSGETNSNSAEEGEDMSTGGTTNREDVQGIEEKVEEKHKSKESESQPKTSKKQRNKRRVHFSPSTEDLFKKSERSSRSTFQMVCDDILEGEMQPNRDDPEQLASSYIIEDLSLSLNKEDEGDYLGVTTCSHDDGQSTSEEEQTKVIDEDRSLWYDDYPAQEEQRCESLGDVTNQHVHVTFKMEESFVAVTERRSEEHFEHIPSSEETSLVEAECAGSIDTSESEKVKVEQIELFTENKNESHAFQEKDSSTASDGAEETVSKEDSFLQEAMGQVDYPLEERTDLPEYDTTHVKEFVDDSSQSLDTLETKEDGLPKDFTDEQKQTDNQAIPCHNYQPEDSDNKQLDIISQYSSYKHITETGSTADYNTEKQFISDQLRLLETDKNLESEYIRTEVQEVIFSSVVKDVLKSSQEQAGPSILQSEDTLLRQPVSRNSTSTDEMCISVLEDVVLGDGLISEEHKEVLGENEPLDETFTPEMEEHQEHINDKPNYDFKHEGFPPETSESQEEDSKVEIDHIKVELLTEQQCVAEEKYVAVDEGLGNEQMQDDKLIRQLVPADGNEECPEESYETDQRASLNEPFHSTLDVSAQKSRILLLRKTSVRRRPGQRPVTFQEDLPDPSPPANLPLNMGVPVFPEKMSTLSPAVPPDPESSYPAEETTEASVVAEPILRRKSSVRRRQRPGTFLEDLAEPSLPGITPAESSQPTQEPTDDGSMSEQLLRRKSSIRRPQGQRPVALEDEPVEPAPPVIAPLKMGVPNFLGGMPILLPAVAPAPESLHPAKEPKDEGTTSETMLRRKSSMRRPKGKQPVTSEEQTVETPPSVIAPLRMGVPLFSGVPAHVTPAPVSSIPAEEPREEKKASEELAIKPKKGFLKHAGFGGAHPGMMQELQARLHKKKPKE